MTEKPPSPSPPTSGINEKNDTTSIGDVLFVLGALFGALAVIGGAIFLFDRLLSSYEELANVDFPVETASAEVSVELSKGDDIDALFDVRSAEATGSTGFPLETSRLTLSMVAPSGAVTDAKCRLYNGWAENAYQRRSYKRPRYDGVKNDCKLPVRESGIHRVTATVDWKRAKIAKARFRLVRR